jgi:hypothetical protein
MTSAEKPVNGSSPTTLALAVVDRTHLGGGPGFTNLG